MPPFARRAFLSLLILASLSFSSCAEFHAQVPVSNDPNDSTATPATDWRGNKTTCSFVWGLIQDPPATVDEKTECGIQQVKVTRDFWQGLVTVCTLGLVSPANVSWRLMAAPIREGALPSQKKQARVAGNDNQKVALNAHQ